MDYTKQKELAEKRQEIINLKSDLTSFASSVGDWKITKIYESRINGEPDPYEATSLIEERQKIRDKIATLQNEIVTLTGESTTDLTDAEKKAQIINELDTGYARAKDQILMAYVAALMSGDTDTQTSLKEQLVELNTDYDTQRKASE